MFETARALPRHESLHLKGCMKAKGQHVERVHRQEQLLKQGRGTETKEGSGLV